MEKKTALSVSIIFRYRIVVEENEDQQEMDSDAIQKALTQLRRDMKRAENGNEPLEAIVTVQPDEDEPFGTVESDKNE